MSQQPSQGPEHNRKNMAVSYTSNLAPARNQTLPSFNELLPPHLHREIDPAYNLSQSRSAQDSPDLNKHQQQQQQQRRQRQQQQQQQLPPPGTAGYPSRGPSPILPPLRDLQSSRHIDRPLSYGRSSLDDDRYHQYSSSTGGGGTGGAAPLAMYNHNHNHNPNQSHNASPTQYGYPPECSSSTEYSTEYSPMTHSHTLPPSSFGVIGGEPLDSRGKRRRGNLPKPVTDILRAWFHEHLDHPYPTEEDKQIFMTRTGLSISQISNWFINARRRQLPALRNQIRNSDDQNMRGASPMSDGVSSPGSTASPTRMR